MDGCERAPQSVKTYLARFLDVSSFRPARTQLISRSVCAVGAGRADAAFQPANLTLECMQPLDREPQSIDKAPLLGVVEFDGANQERNFNARAAQTAPRPQMRLLIGFRCVLQLEPLLSS